MKRFVAPVVIVLLIAAIAAVVIVSAGRRQGHVVILTGNTGRTPVPMEPGVYQDTRCAMLIEDVTQAAQAVDRRGRTWFFDDVGCLALWLDTARDPDELALWVQARDTGQWLDARRAWYVRDAETVMEYGFAPYATVAPDRVDFRTMQRMMLRGENLTDPYVRKELLDAD